MGKAYPYSLIASSHRSYFWLLSRAPMIDKN
ncbi:MAG: lipocalin family protein [Oleispira sp.]|nr:lipocalin family protein [Oleispira sp.]